jgi:hypothetical protein
VRDLTNVVLASLIGGLLGYTLASRAQEASAADVRRIETKELVVLGDNGQPAARILARSGGASLEFYDSGGSKAVELGFEESQSMRFLTFLDHDGRILAGLNSSAPKGEATLYLGDGSLQTRMVIGAIRSDVEEPITDWGFQIRTPGSVIPVFSILTRPGRASKRWEAGIRILKEDGKVWTAPH